MLPEIIIAAPGTFIPEPDAIPMAITTGVMLHLATESLSDSGITLIGKKRITLRLYRTFILSEFIVVFFVLTSCGIGLTLRRFLFS